MTDEDGDDIVEVLWSVHSQSADSEPTFAAQDSVDSVFTATESGLYVLSLVASDGTESRTDYLVVTVEIDLPPQAVATADTLSGPADLVVEFDASESTDPEEGDLTFAWDFGDDTSATSVSPTHTYATDGDYMVTLTVTDEQSRTHVDTLVVSVMKSISLAPQLFQATKERP